jgi:hypothetical protein
MLGLLVRELHLDQYRQQLAEQRRRVVQALRRLQRIERVHRGEQLRRLCGFVVLQRPDEVHLQVRQVAQRCGLGLPLLDAVFSE